MKSSKVAIFLQKRIKEKKRIEKLAEKILKKHKIKKGLNIILVDDEYISQLNEKFLKRKGPTDVISFALNEEELIGEVYISMDRARAQAEICRISFFEELKRLVAHGILHILGYSHEKMDEVINQYISGI